MNAIQTVAFVAFAAYTFANPMPTISRRSITQLEVPGGRLRSIHKDLQRLCHKYGRAGPFDVDYAFVQSNGTAEGEVAYFGGSHTSVDAMYTPSHDAYVSRIKIGDQELDMDFDTGSSDIWVYSTLQPAEQTINNRVYDPTQSYTSRKVWGTTLQIAYVGGTKVDADVYTDFITVSNIAAEKAFGVATWTNDDVPGDGLFGLGLPAVSQCYPNACMTWMTHIGPALESNLFTVSLHVDKPGTYDFGYIDNSKYTGSIGYTPVIEDRFWMINVDSVRWNNVEYLLPTTRFHVDTGTTLMILPPHITVPFWDNVEGAYYEGTHYRFPCTSYIPDFGLRIGGVLHTIPGGNLIRGVASNGECISSMMRQDWGDHALLGDAFLTNVFTVFDVGGNRVGFASKA